MHEAGHVVQQGIGTARGSGILHSTGLEMQADAGFAAPAGFTMPASGAGPIQGFDWFGRKRRAAARDAARGPADLQKAEEIRSNIVQPSPDAARPRFTGLNGKLMRKNMQYMQKAQNDMHVGVNAITGDDMTLPDTAGAMAYPTNRTISYNPRYATFPAVPNRREKDRKYGFVAQNHNYTGVHEYGHIVNFDLARRMYGDGEYNNDIIGNLTAQEIVRESGMNAARRSKSFRKSLARKAGFHLNHRRMDELSPKDISRMQSALTPANLHEMGYLSGYGTMNHAETIAESFADEYRTRNKKEKEKSRWFNFGRKKTHSNPFAREIVNVSQRLSNNDAYRDDFKARHQSQRDQNKTKQATMWHWINEDSNQTARYNVISQRVVASGGDARALENAYTSAAGQAAAMQTGDELMTLIARVGLIKQVLDDWESRYPAPVAAAPAAAAP
jgi:hypothetical protein